MKKLTAICLACLPALLCLGAAAVRIYSTSNEKTELAREQTGEICECSAQYNSAATVRFWAVARYHGA